MRPNAKIVYKKPISPSSARQCWWIMSSGNWRTAAAPWSKPNTGWRWCLTGRRGRSKRYCYPKTHVLRITDLSDEQRDSLALALKKLTSPL
ncbi:galactose-1-phosphate uridylyltransferase [Salmonella enterica subsp. enterica]|uniref:Galactose-1-phosphate uridylyltransferase n=1 Tax=Salmonella enterica I TaxID=59201 RepID=A0A379WXG7_SALET|nr:galactose-1-phosphate uridylyltransferase [Salmonella enterica subsp. enterica]